MADKSRHSKSWGKRARQHVCKGPEVGMDQARVKSKVKGRAVQHHEPRGEEPRRKGARQGPDPVRLLEHGQEVRFCAERAAMGSWLHRGGKCVGGERTSRAFQILQGLGLQLIVQWSLEPTCLTLPKGPG